MSVPSLHEFAQLRAQMRAIKLNMGEPYKSLPKRTVLAALTKHGGLYTLLDQDMMAARLTAMNAAQLKKNDDGKMSGKKQLTVDAAGKLRAMVQNFFYKLVDRDGYLIHSELMAYISEPGKGNGVTFDLGANPSPTIPAAFTFVGQFIDHDLTLNGMNLTEDENGIVVQDKASPVIDLDSVYGVLVDDAVPRKPDQPLDTDSPKFAGFKKVFDKIFDENGCFRHEPITAAGSNNDCCSRPPLAGNDEILGYDLPREKDATGNCAAVIFDPRNDENQLILQIHILIQRFHNKLIKHPLMAAEIAKLNPADPAYSIRIVELVRYEVVATWQHFVLTEYMPSVIRKEVLDFIIEEINKPASSADHPETQYGDLKHKPYKNLVTGKNVVRMPHEFAIGFRFGHSQLRPFYILNGDTAVILFKDARQNAMIHIKNVEEKYKIISGKDDLKGSRLLSPEHVIDWNVFYPKLSDSTAKPDENKQSLRIDHKVTARVFNLPETAIPDDIKYIGNLPHRNLIRSSQIGIVSGEELAEFYGLDSQTPVNPANGEILTPDEILGDDAGRKEVEELFKMDSEPENESDPKDKSEKEEKKFKTPLWYYLLKEAEIHSKKFCVPVEIEKESVCRNQLGKVGSRLVGEVLAGALYYGSDFPIDNNWISMLHQTSGQPVSQTFGSVNIADSITLHEIIDFVNS